MNLSQMLHDKTSPNKWMSDGIFQSLLENKKLEVVSESEYGYHCKYNNYGIHFCMDDSNDLLVIHFGKQSKDWIELEPTDDQINEMRSLLTKIELKVDLEAESGYIDHYYDNGVSRKDFY